MQHINELPEGWEMKKLGEVLSFVGGGTPDKSNKQFWGGDIPWASVKDIKEKYLHKTQDFISESGLQNSSSHVVMPGELILITRISPGKTSISKIKTAINQDLKIVKPKTEVDIKFIHYLFETIEKEIIKKSSGTTVLGIRLEVLKEIEIPLPPLPTQHAIVAKIEALFSELDHGVAQLKTAQQQLKVYRQAVLKWAFEGKLGGNGKAAEMRDEGALPEGWKWVKLGEAVTKVFDGPFGSNLKSSDYVEEGVRVIRLENIGVLEFKDENKSFVTESKYLTIQKHTVRNGDIIFSSFVMGETRVTVLPKHITRAINKADCFCIRANPEIADANFLTYYLSTKALYNQLVDEIHGATRPRINTTQLKSCLIPLPPLATQHAIVQEIESRLSVCDKVQEMIEKSLREAEVLRQSVLKRAFEGKLVTK